MSQTAQTFGWLSRYGARLRARKRSRRAESKARFAMMTLTPTSTASTRIDGSSCPRQPVGDGNPVPDLPHQLQVHRASVGLKYSQQTLQAVFRAH